MTWLRLRRRLARQRHVLRTWFASLIAAAKESGRYLNYSSTLQRQKSRQTLQGLIIRQAHSLEVGLTYQPTRPGFGAAAASSLVVNLADYLQSYPSDRLVVHALETLREYCKTNRSLNHPMEQIEESAKCLAQGVRFDWLCENSCSVHADQAVGISHFDELARARRSCREYKPDPVDIGIINAAVNSALRSPSACNRQPWRVYLVEGAQARKKVLDLQNNRSAWRSKAGHILIVTVDQGFYNGIRERNAPFVDGGLFCMTLAYALHARGLGTCMLNLNIGFQELDELRTAIQAGKGEVPIMMIAIGHPAEDYPVCRKFQREPSEVISVVGHREDGVVPDDSRWKAA